MSWLENAWYQAGWADELAEGTALARTILDRPMLFLRGRGGEVGAVLDRCPHRFAPLSAGMVSGGVVTCGYHGLGFDGSGACVANPHGPVTAAMRVQSFPVVERHDALWVWPGDPALADAALVPDLSFIDETPEAGRIKGYLPTRANYQLIADNILDLSHADYLHPTTLGGMMSTAKARTWEDGDRVVAEWMAKNCDAPPAFHANVPPPAKADIWTEVRWAAPAVMVLSTAATPSGVQRTPGDIGITLHNMTPETATSTHYFFCSTRRFLLDDAGFSAMLRGALNQAFLGEDKPMLERQQARMGTDDLWSLNPILLPVDAGAVRARRRLDRLIRAEQAAA